MSRPRWTILAVIIPTAVILASLLSIVLLVKASCSSVQTIDASIKVKIIPGRGMLGLNADTDSLKFGVVSPGMIATRKVTVQHPRKAMASIAMKGQLSSWTAVSPSVVELEAGETKEVLFEVAVPAEALVGNYTGEAVFCIKEN